MSVYKNNKQEIQLYETNLKPQFFRDIKLTR